MLPVAVDAMGGDEAPGPILAGAHRAAASGIPIVLVGPSDLDGRTGPDGRILDLIEASEVIGMHDDPAQGVRRKKDSTLVRAAEAVRDGKASAMISAGKLDNCRVAIGIAREAREMLGGNGITLEHSPLRHANNLESVRTYEGTDEVHQLTLGRHLTGIGAFAPAR